MPRLGPANLPFGQRLMRRQHALYRLFAALCLAYAGWVLRSTIQLELSRAYRYRRMLARPDSLTRSRYAAPVRPFSRYPTL